MRKYGFVLLLLSATLWSCKTIQTEVCQTEISKERSLDYERDTVYIVDSVCIFVHGDTVFRDRVHTKYKERVVARVDTIYSTNTVVEKQVVEKKVIPKWVWYCVGGCVIIVFLLIIGVILKIK